MTWRSPTVRFIRKVFQVLDQYAGLRFVGGARRWRGRADAPRAAPPQPTSYLLFDMDREVRRAAARRARVAPVGQVFGLRQCPHCGTDLPPLAFIDRCRVCGERPGRRA